MENYSKEERISKINYAEKVLKEAQNVKVASITREEQYNKEIEKCKDELLKLGTTPEEAPNKIKALEGTTQDFELQFGENGADGKYDWKGQLIVYITGGGVDEARKMTIVISAETEITAGV